MKKEKKERKKWSIYLSAAKIMHLHANYEEIFYQGVKIPLILGEVSIIMIFQFYTILK